MMIITIILATHHHEYHHQGHHPHHPHHHRRLLHRHPHVITIILVLPTPSSPSVPSPPINQPSTSSAPLVITNIIIIQSFPSNKHQTTVPSQKNEHRLRANGVPVPNQTYQVVDALKRYSIVVPL